MTIFAHLQDWLVQQGIDAEIRRAGLVEDTMRLPFGHIVYLRRAGPPPPGAEAEAEAVLMLHGATADRTSWVRFAKYLKTGLPLLIPDLPGHGKSVADASLSYAIDAQAARVAAFLDALQVARVHVIASSMGGAIALRLAADRRGLVSSLVLIGAVGVQARPSWLQEHMDASGRNPMIEVRNRHDYAAMIRIGMEQPPAMPGFVVSALARAYIARLPVNEKIGRDIALDLDQAAVLPAIDCPVLLIWGREDRVSHPANGALLHERLPHSRLVLLDDVGHVPMVEVPKLVAGQCSAFLAQAVVATGPEQGRQALQ